MRTRGIRNLLLASGLAFLAFVPGCWDDDDDDDNGSPSPADSTYQDSNLVSDDSAYGARRIDSNLVNPWGMVLADGNQFWVANNGTGKVTVYNGSGDSVGATATIPGRDTAAGGSPTGMVRNTSNYFLMPNATGPAIYIFAGDDGTLSAWRSGNTATLVYTDSTAGAAYTGLTIATDSGRPYLYVADFGGKQVKVFDTSFRLDTTRAFEDTTLPDNYAPFNIAKVDTLLYVTYALVGSGGEEVAGVGNGYVNVFTARGVMVRRFASQGALNAPWGMAKSNGTFGRFQNALFVGNFGDGHILAYDTSGALLGEVLGQGGEPIELEGLWEIIWVPSGTVGGVSGNSLFYTAGPGDEEHGAFGYIVNP